MNPAHLPLAPTSHPLPSRVELPSARCPSGTPRRLSRRGFSEGRFSIHGAVLPVLLAAVCPALPASGEVIQDVVTVSEGVIGAEDWGITYFQPNGDGTQLVVNLTRSSTPVPAVEMTPVNYYVGIPFSWYESSEDDVFDAAAVERLTPFGANWDVRTPIQVPVETPFFLACWSGSTYDDEASDPIIGPMDYYTWGKFVVNDTAGELQLSVLESAASLNGIVVGKPVSVPEPSVAALTLAGLGVLSGGLWRRRRSGAAMGK